MVKAANVVLVAKEYIGAGYVTVLCGATSGPSRPPQTPAPRPPAVLASWCRFTLFPVLTQKSNGSCPRVS